MFQVLTSFFKPSLKVYGSELVFKLASLFSKSRGIFVFIFSNLLILAHFLFCWILVFYVKFSATNYWLLLFVFVDWRLLAKNGFYMTLLHAIRNTIHPGPTKTELMIQLEAVRLVNEQLLLSYNQARNELFLLKHGESFPAVMPNVLLTSFGVTVLN